MSTNFPTSVDSFPIHTDNTNEKIAAATINNLQDAIVALENAAGILSNLTTTDKSSSTNAINEVKATITSSINALKGGSTKTMQDIEILIMMGAI